jgi:transcriptional regulator with GAF, ATPase, and Fis domain
MAETAKFERFFEVITEVSRALHESGDLKQALSVMVQTITAVFEARGCLLRMLDSTGAELELLASAGLSSAYLDKGVVVADPTRSEVFDQSIVVIADVAKDPRVQYPQAALKEGIVSIIGVPFQITGAMRMVLRIYFDRASSSMPRTGAFSIIWRSKAQRPSKRRWYIPVTWMLTAR